MCLRPGRKVNVLPLLACMAICCLASGRALAVDALAKGFLTPPDAAKPRVWWSWTDGDITKDGIKLDLQWMHRVGVGGLQNFFDMSFGPTPKIVAQRLGFMTRPRVRHRGLPRVQRIGRPLGVPRAGHEKVGVE